MAAAFILLLQVVVLGQQPTMQAPGPLTDARKQLALRHYAQASVLFGALARSHATSAADHVEAQLGLADAELGLHQFAAAERHYREVVFAEPELWIAHKNLVIVEAALGRWEEFDRERALLRAARDRQAPGIRRDEADVIDTFDVPQHPLKKGDSATQHWIVREYYEPLGRTAARYNFESFSPEGRVLEYLSLEADVPPAVAGVPVVIGGAAGNDAAVKGYALNFYTGHAHGSIARYATEPAYERLRSDARAWMVRGAEARP